MPEWGEDLIHLWIALKKFTGALKRPRNKEGVSTGHKILLKNKDTSGCPGKWQSLLKEIKSSSRKSVKSSSRKSVPTKVINFSNAWQEKVSNINEWTGLRRDYGKLEITRPSTHGSHTQFQRGHSNITGSSDFPKEARNPDFYVK